MSEDKDFLEELKKDFLDEITFLIEQCEESYLKLEEPTFRKEELGKIFRVAHSIKGGGAAVGFNDLAGFAHIVEDCLSLLRANSDLVDTTIISALLQAGDAFKIRVTQLKQKDETPWNIEEIQKQIEDINKSLQGQQQQENTAAARTPDEKVSTFFNSPELFASKGHPELNASKEASVTAPTGASVKSTASLGIRPAAAAVEAGGSVKIDTDRIENVLDIVGELVVVKSQLMNQCANYSQDLRLTGIVSLMDRTIRELQEKTLSMRMTPLKGLFLKMQRIIRDLSLKLQKPVELRLAGEDIEIDRTMVELLTDPLMHMVRNSLDHGIEGTETRKNSNKPEKGLINLSASQSGGRIFVKIEDDGGGIKFDKIVEKAKAKGIIDPKVDPATLSQKEIFSLIFMPGFSTVEKVTDLSGRGVGMDVVKTNIERLKGTIDVHSETGKGTCMTISIPLTTSITDGMIVESAGQKFILPLDEIKELVTLDPKTFIETEPGHNVMNHRDRILPLLSLSRLIDSPSASLPAITGQIAAIVQVDNKSIAFCLDRVLGQTQVVLKPLGTNLRNIPGIAGVAILGDGKVALVLDPTSLVKFMQGDSKRKSMTGIAV